ncbi:hypothetical protein BDF14DRAFT_1738107, partial [Spinellus fusiger]
TKSCVFIDEARFNINMKSSKEAISERPLTRALSYLMVGYITLNGVINVSIREPLKTPKVRRNAG